MDFLQFAQQKRRTCHQYIRDRSPVYSVDLSIFIGLTAASSWIEDRIGILPPVFNLMQFGRYPLTIYGAWIRFALTFHPLRLRVVLPNGRFLRRQEFTREFWAVPIITAIELEPVGRWGKR